MIDPLAGAKLKVERAKKHVADFDFAKVAFLASDPYRVATKFKVQPESALDTGQTDCCLEHAEPIPALLPLIVGDAAHNLRSALDHLAVALVEANEGPAAVTNRTAFPICESLEKYESESRGKTRGMRKEAEHAIDRVAPYPGGNNLLFGIHELDRIDKHRVLVTVAYMVARIGLEMGPEEMNNFAPDFIRFQPKSIPRHTYWFDPGPQIFRVGIQEGEPIVSIAGKFEGEQDVRFTFDIAFGEPQILYANPVVGTLSAAIEVVESLLTDFEPFLL